MYVEISFFILNSYEIPIKTSKDGLLYFFIKLSVSGVV